MSELLAFIERKSTLFPYGDKELPYCFARYRIGHYDMELFNTHSIALPIQVHQSVVKRQAEFIAGRLCAQQILSSFGHRGFSVDIGQHREPIWPEAFVGSITHNRKLAAAAVLPIKDVIGIGIDIETVIDIKTFQAISRSIVSHDEWRSLVTETPDVSPNYLFTLVFSVKESFFKAAFANVKRLFNFDAVRVTHIDVRQRTIQCQTTLRLCDEINQFKQVQAHYISVDQDSVMTMVVLE